MNYKVVFSSRAIKDLKPIERSFQGKIIAKIESLAENPYPTGCIKLKAIKEDLWRIRVGDYRILYHVDDFVEIIDIRKIDHRRDIYLPK